MNGEILGDRYELIEKVGEGGMAVVYKARCNKLNRFVAVKILKSEYSDNEEIVKKFKREATAIAKLSHNNIVNVLDVGTQGETNYIVMEYVDGKTLKEVIEDFGKVSYETTLTISIQIAKALECAHKNGIIHRDIKPQNILVTKEGLVKVTDFGIAKSVDSATLTNTSTILGSAHYFSPEQAKGGFIDNKTDIYSLGIVMYEMLTGKLPFEADSPVTIALKHLQEEPVPPKSINSRIPESLNKLVLKCMEKDAEKRYDNANELISDLEKIKENPDAEIGLNEDNLNDNDATVQHTIVMAPIKEPIVDDEYDEDDEDYYDDEEYDDDDYEGYDSDENYKVDKEDNVKNNPKNKRNKSKSKGIIIGVISVLLICLLGGGAYFMLSGNKGKEVTVPNFVGMNIADAQKEAANLKIQLTIKQVKSDEKPGTIIASNPKAGEKIKEGSTVEVDVSSEEKITMPNLVEDSLDDAKAKLESLGIKNITVQEDYSDSIPKGQVMSQNPASGQDVTKEMSVTLVVSKGKKIETVTVPALNGLSEKEARGKLNALGLNANVATNNTTDKSLDGKVIGQNPGNGATVNKGETVTIQIGVYKEESINIGSIINTNMTGNEALSALSAKGITNVSLNGDGNDKVSGWTPDTLKSKDSQVTITTKADKINVGSIISKGMKGSDAKAALESEGFSVSLAGDGADGVVTGWNPNNATKGSTITVTTEASKPATKPDDSGDSENPNKNDRSKK